MTQPTKYPSPTAAHEELGPFYNTNQHQHHIPSAENSHIPHPRAATMHGTASDTRDFGQGNYQNGQNIRQPQPATPQQLAQRGLDANQGNHLNPPDSASRKRSKVSRACDECRRKKIRCDAESETPGTQCSACRRAGVFCGFSRAPQKRGPSKGYIKELAERVNMLEYRGFGSAATPPEVQYASLIEDQTASGFTPPAPGPTEYSPRKRTYDTTEGSPPYNHIPCQIQEYTPRQQSTFPDKLPRGIQAQKLRGLPEDNQTPKHPEIQAQAQSDHRFEPSKDTQSHNDPQSAMIGAHQLRFKMLELYYKVIHPYFPVLAHDTGYVFHYLSAVPQEICDALFAAIDATNSLCTSSKTAPLDHALGLVAALQLEERFKTRTLLDNLVCLQVLILLIIAEENAGPSCTQRGATCARAINYASSMQLHQIQVKDFTSSLCRRAWLVLVTLDRWISASTAGNMMIDDDAIQLTESDEARLGSPAFYLVRVSIALGHVTKASVYYKADFGHPPSNLRGFLTNVTKAEIDNVLVCVRAFPSHSQLHLACFHLQNYANSVLRLHSPNASKISDGALKVVKLLREWDSPSICPLTHHWTALAASNLAQSVEKFGEQESSASLHDLYDQLSSGQLRTPFSNPSDPPAWDRAITRFIAKKLHHGGDPHSSRGGLDHLANAAVGESEPGNFGQPDDTAKEDEGFSWATAVLPGYLADFE